MEHLGCEKNGQINPKPAVQIQIPTTKIYKHRDDAMMIFRNRNINYVSQGGMDEDEVKKKTFSLLIVQQEKKMFVFVGAALIAKFLYKVTSNKENRLIASFRKL